jgi:hypothetical protein
MRPRLARTSRLRTPGGRRGFTLLETGMALVVIMVGVVAMIEAQRGFIVSNAWSSHEATASHLAGEIRERMRILPRHDPVSGLVMVNGQLVGLGREQGEVTVNDLDDIDDYHDINFGEAGNFDGPIDAFGRVIPEVDAEGNIRIDPGTGQPMPLQGWSQSVVVEKIDPYNFAVPVAWTAVQAPSGNGAFPGRALDAYPLKVTVTVSYLGPYDAEPREIVSMSWIVPDSQ